MGRNQHKYRVAIAIIFIILAGGGYMMLRRNRPVSLQRHNLSIKIPEMQQSASTADLNGLKSDVAIANEDAFSVILVPDTQQLVELESELFFAQMRWIAGEQDRMNTKFVIHLGDIVQTDAIKEWEVADKAYRILDEANIPYSVTVGNHDLGLMRDTEDRRDATRFNTYFGPHRFRGKSWYGGHYDSGNENNYTIFEATGMQFLVLSLELGPRDEVLEWANTVVREHPQHRVIIATHSYLCDDNNRVGSPERSEKFKNGYDHDCYGPQRYTGGADGEMMWQKFVKHHPNIFMVVSGHTLGDGAGYRKDIGVHGNVVHQILTNYQMIGYAWLRILKFVPAQDKIEVIPDTPLRLGRYTDAYDHLTSIGYFDPPEDWVRTGQLPGFFYRRNDPEHMFEITNIMDWKN